jgi:hypothetical protein
MITKMASQKKMIGDIKGSDYIKITNRIPRKIIYTYSKTLNPQKVLERSK